MAWDRAGESHEDQTMFGLIPEDETGRRGLLLRDRGYAEKAPVAGQFRMDDENGLILTTDYEMMSSLERFWFASENVRLRTSTGKGSPTTPPSASRPGSWTMLIRPAR